MYSKVLLTCSLLQNQYFTIYYPKEVKSLSIAKESLKDPSQFDGILAKRLLTHFVMNTSWNVYCFFFPLSFTLFLNIFFFSLKKNLSKFIWILSSKIKIDQYKLFRNTSLWQLFSSKPLLPESLIYLASYDNVIIDLVKNHISFNNENPQTDDS